MYFDHFKRCDCVYDCKISALQEPACECADWNELSASEVYDDGACESKDPQLAQPREVVLIAGSELGDGANDASEEDSSPSCESKL